jgi:hypothetical protein
VVGTGVGWTKQSTGRTNGREENWSGDRQSRRTYGRKGDLSKAMWKRELVRYTDINKWIQNLSKGRRTKIRKIK